jgi:hypothetical protein
LPPSEDEAPDPFEKKPGSKLHTLVGMVGLDRVARLRLALRRHRVLVVLVAAGLVLRVLVQVAYRPALVYIDSIAGYLNPLSTLDPTGPDPLGYDILLLKPVLAIGNLAAVAAVQHLLGLAMGVTIYALLVHKGVTRWLAALAAAPVLLDAYQVQIEQNLMSDSLFQALLVAGFAVLAWPARPGWRTGAVAGVILGAAALTRLVGEPVILAALMYLLIVATGWRHKLTAVAATAAAFAAPLVACASYYHARTGEWALSHDAGRTLYGRVGTFADCRGLSLPEYERPLCPTIPREQRHGPEYWAHSGESPGFHFTPPPGRSADSVLRDFSVRIIVHQPLDFARATLVDAAGALSWQRTDAVNPDASVERWRFQREYPFFPDIVTPESVAALGARYGGGPAVVVTPVAIGLRWYQLHLGYTPGPLQGLAVLLAIAGLARRTPQRAVCALYLAGGLLVLLAADAFEFTWRYQLPGLVLLPVAGALGLTALTGRAQETSFPEPADEEALAEFTQRYGEPSFPPVVVLIAAYNEADGIGAVLDTVPATSCGLDVKALVVVDGSTDATAEVTRRHGAYACVVPTNRGQGAALRLGYHLARTGGARFIVTTDADGQYDLAELPLLLKPLLADEADFVTGSRRLGTDFSPDPVRRAGVRFFAWLISRLTGHRVTDTSFGFRAMRAPVTGAVTLTQPQYQSAELLVGVLSRGYRVLEQPMTMRPRGAGRSKKGNNLAYGLRYARVVMATWWRERNSDKSPSPR